MNTNTMDKQEKSIAEKLNQLTNITTFWDDVRKHTTKSMSTATMRKWEYLADRRYAEILTGVEDVRAEVEEYGKPMRYYAPDGKEVFPKEKRSATKCKDSNGKEILTGMIIRISNAENKSDNGLFFVAESPCDLSWKNQTVHVLRKIDEYGVELNYVSFYPLISFDENGNEITLHSDAEIVEITDTGFSEISQYFINKKMQANIKWNHTLNCFETVENRNKQNEEIEFYESVIGNIKNGFKASIAEENVEKPNSTEEQPENENPKGESIMNNMEIPTIKNLSQLKKALKANSGMMFEILDCYNPERIGKILKVTSVNSVNFTSRVIDESGEITGKDIYGEFGKACCWKFEGEKISHLFTTGDVITSFRFITENSIINGNSAMPKYNTEEQATGNLTTTEQSEEPQTAWTGKADYAERRAEKAERYAERAEKARATADRLQKPTEENSVEETLQPTTENIVYPFILVDTPTAQPETAEEKTVEEQPTENSTVAQPVITFDETLLSKARQMYYKVYVDSISDDGINYIGSETEILGIRARIIPSDSWDDSITFYSAEKFAEYMNRELKLESATENHMTREEILQAIEEETKASISPQQILFYGEKLLESVVWLDGIRNTIAEIAFWKYGTGADKDFEILTIEVDRIQQNILDSLFKTENQTAEPPIETITVEDVEIAVDKIPEAVLEYKGDSEKLAMLKDKALSLGATVSSTENHLTIDTYENHRPEIESVATELDLKTDEEMHETFNAVQGKINEVGTIEQKNIILSIKTENRLEAISALIDSVTPMTTDKAMKLISNNMEKPGATAEQIAQAEIAIQYIGNPNFRQKLNDYVFAKTYKTEENTSTDSIASDSETSAQWKIRPPPMATGY